MSLMPLWLLSRVLRKIIASHKFYVTTSLNIIVRWLKLCTAYNTHPSLGKVDLNIVLNFIEAYGFTTEGYQTDTPGIHTGIPVVEELVT